jgi:ADP-heptose:LPS heptosyltransferase
LESKGIKIIQLGQEKEKVYTGVLSLVGLTNINQTAFVLRSSLLHVGADSFPTHIASGYGKKIVALYSNNYIFFLNQRGKTSQLFLLKRTQRQSIVSSQRLLQTMY